MQRFVVSTVLLGKSHSEILQMANAIQRIAPNKTDLPLFRPDQVDRIQLSLVSVMKNRLLIAAFVIVASASSSASPEPEARPPGEQGVEVQLFEALNPSAPLDLSQATETDRYREPAFGFVTLPIKYSPNGLPLDRSSPFALRAHLAKPLPEGRHQIRLRAKGSAQLRIIQGKQILSLQTKPQRPNKSSHDVLPPPPFQDPHLPELKAVSAPHQEIELHFYSDGTAVEFELISIIGGKGLVPSPAELSVSVAPYGELPLLLSATDRIPLTREAWAAYRAERMAFHAEANDDRRRETTQEVRQAWEGYHETVRDWVSTSLPPIALPNSIAPHQEPHPIDRLIRARLKQSELTQRRGIDDHAFFRRLVLDLTGRLPTEEELEAYLGNPSEARRSNAIDRFLASPEWADPWVGYWQDVLAENPGILKPDLNNSGPFRWWLQQTFEDNLPMDRFAAELVQMKGSALQGAPAAFAMATLNDAPMAAKADILMQAFQAEKLSCARCHDAPEHRHKQIDAFHLAAMLHGDKINLPESSTVPVIEGFRKPRVDISLAPGAEILPAWPFQELSANHNLMSQIPLETNVPPTRNAFARHLVTPTNRRFAEVMVNRVWKRYLGAGLVEPAEDWEYSEASNPELLNYLSREFTAMGYDLKQLARLILTSATYQAHPTEEDLRQLRPNKRHFSGPNRRRMSAEQVVDSIFRLAGKPVATEELNLNPLGDRPLSQFLNLGVPKRAWEFAALMNERDRPSLALPSAQAVVDVLTAFGWRQSRMNPITDRDDAASTRQSLILANGVAGTQITRLTDDNQFTELALRKDALGDLVDATVRRILTRPANQKEHHVAELLLQSHFADRKIEGVAMKAPITPKQDHRVSWANHFDSQSNSIRLDEERRVREGATPTQRLSTSFREAYEDFIWSLINSAEFITIP